MPKISKKNTRMNFKKKHQDGWRKNLQKYLKIKIFKKASKSSKSSKKSSKSSKIPLTQANPQKYVKPAQIQYNKISKAILLSWKPSFQIF